MTAIREVSVPSLPTEVNSIDEFMALDPDDQYRLEAVEGRLMMSPSPLMDHARACLRLGTVLDMQAPGELVVVTDIDVNLEIGRPGAKPNIRRPDIVVCAAEARDRLANERGLLRASEVVLVIEVLSPSSERIDSLHKRADYADAGIPNYWLVDLGDRARLRRWELDPMCDYKERDIDSGTVTIEEPFRAVIDLNALR